MSSGRPIQLHHNRPTLLSLQLQDSTGVQLAMLPLVHITQPPRPSSADPTHAPLHFSLIQVHIVKAGALPNLVRLTALGREKLDVSRYCGMTLSNLACHRQNRGLVVQAGGLKPLCDMAFDGERLEMQRAAGLALYNLSCAAANQVSCYSSAGVTPKHTEAHGTWLL